MTPANTHSTLVEARRLLDRDGWVQGVWGGPDIGYCALGAIGHADEDYGGEDYGGAKRALAAAAGVTHTHRPGGTTDDLIDWNNAPGRTKAEVLAAFDAAIASTGTTS